MGVNVINSIGQSFVLPISGGIKATKAKGKQPQVVSKSNFEMSKGSLGIGDRGWIPTGSAFLAFGAIGIVAGALIGGGAVVFLAVPGTLLALGGGAMIGYGAIFDNKSEQIVDGMIRSLHKSVQLD